MSANTMFRLVGVVASLLSIGTAYAMLKAETFAGTLIWVVVFMVCFVVTLACILRPPDA